MLQDVGHAVGRFVEVDRDGNRARAVDGKIRRVPFGTVRGEKPDAIARLYAQFHERGRQARDAAQKFLGGNGFPAAVPAHHLRVRDRQIINRLQKA